MKGMGLINRGSIAGVRYGRLVAVVKACGGKNSAWVCKCDCGAEVTVKRNNLRCGHTKSCGCLNSELSNKRATKHGLCQRDEYYIWSTMIARCNNPKSSSYKNYGAKGVSVCERWAGESGFANFYLDMGERPSSGHTLDRYPNMGGNYEPSNCRWATRKEQAINRKSTMFIQYAGETRHQKELAGVLKVSNASLCRMIKIKGVDAAIKYYQLKNLSS